MLTSIINEAQKFMEWTNEQNKVYSRCSVVTTRFLSFKAWPIDRQTELFIYTRGAYIMGIFTKILAIPYLKSIKYAFDIFVKYAKKKKHLKANHLIPC